MPLTLPTNNNKPVTTANAGSGSSSSGYYTYVNGKMVWVPKTVTVPKPTSTVPKPITQVTDTGTSGIIPPPPAAKPLVMTDPAAFEQQDSAAVSLMKTPKPKPTQAELDKILADLRLHAADQWKYAGTEDVGLTPKDAARIKGQIPFSEVMPNDFPKIDNYTYTPTGIIPHVTIPTWLDPAPTESEMAKSKSTNPIPKTTIPMYDSSNAEADAETLKQFIDAYGEENGKLLMDMYGYANSAGNIPGTSAYNERIAIEKWLDGSGPQPTEISPLLALYYGLDRTWWYDNYLSKGTGYLPDEGATRTSNWTNQNPLPYPGTEGTTPTGPTQSEEPLVVEQPTLPDITWEEKYHVEGAPDWWRGMIPSRYDAQSEYASMLNSMIPFMSPEDQRYTASFLYRLYPQYFASYSSFASNETIPQAPTELTTEQRQYMTSYQRAQAILDTLEKVKQISGNPKLGPGYAYLQELGSVLRDYGAKGTGNSQTRQQYQQMMGALDPLIAENQQENLSAYSALTRMLTQPYYTAGQIHPTTTLQDNSVISGTPIKNYF